MPSVVNRIAEIKQPYGGYIPTKNLTVKHLRNDKELFPIANESIPPADVRLIIKYMTDFMLFGDAEKAFELSLDGAELAEDCLQYRDDIMSNFQDYVDHIMGLDDMSLTYVSYLVRGDLWRRLGFGPSDIGSCKCKFIRPLDYPTLTNIKIMMNRTLKFEQLYGPITYFSFTFPGGYTETVNSGDGDFLTEDCLWGLKTSKKKPSNKHTLQLLMYYLMGKHSGQDEFENIDKIGMSNPYLMMNHLIMKVIIYR